MSRDEQGFVESVFRESRRWHVLEGPQNGRNAVHDSPEVFWSRGGDPVPQANMALNGTFADPRAGVASMLRAFEGLPFLWFVREEPAFDPLRAAMREAGFRHEDDERCMFLELAEGHPPPAAEGLVIRPVLDAADAERYLSAYAQAFGLPPLGVATWRAHHLPMLPDRSRLRQFVGEVGGEPVASGTAFLGREAVGVYSIGVVPALRGRGIGAAMTWRVVEEGLREGRTRAVLGATAEGAGVYHRLGFRDVGGLGAWAPPPG
jgi:GNAT superfamily N-acetyltransferase